MIHGRFSNWNGKNYIAVDIFKVKDGKLAEHWNVRLTNELVEFINTKMIENLSIDEKLNLSFDAHFNLVSIHPFYDGNGRTSRLLMNYIQAFYGLPLTIVNSEDKQGYIQSLIDTREKEDIKIFRDFMKNQYEEYLSNEIKKFEDGFSSKSNNGFSFLF